jgi:hypothetical protein
MMGVLTEGRLDFTDFASGQASCDENKNRIKTISYDVASIRWQQLILAQIKHG